MSEDREKTRQIVEYYDARAAQHGDSGHATLLDDEMRRLEIETVSGWLDETDRVLEVFCGNGVSTLALAARCASIVGCDLSAEMIASAKRNLAARAPAGKSVVFERGDVLEIDAAYRPGQFDTVVSVRGLINLPSWELQKATLRKIWDLLPPHGKLILLEGDRGGLDAINRARARWSLAPLAEPWYDRYFEEPALTEFLAPLFEVASTRDLSAYFLVSRVLYPAACRPSAPEFGHVCNTVARLLVEHATTSGGTSLLTCRCLRKR